MKKVSKLICKIFGHSYDEVELLVLAIKLSAVNKDELDIPEITCSRCGHVRRNLTGITGVVRSNISTKKEDTQE